MRQKATIPILGIDERPNERQRTPGLCEELLGLQPRGLPEDPEWESLPPPQDLGVVHADLDSLIQTAWHVRGRIGKHGDGGTLKRLVCLFDSGKIEVLNLDWTSVVSYQAVSADVGEWEMSFTQQYDAGYITLTKGGVPQQDLILEDDLLIPVEFPDLPIVRSFAVTGEKAFSAAEIDGGSYTGFTEGSMFVRYAYKLTDGTLVKHSKPEQIVFGALPGTVFTWKIAHHFDGYATEPANKEYWKDKIKGIAVLLSEFKAASYEDPVLDVDTQSALLANTAWFHVDDFDFIEPDEEKDRIILSSASETNIASFLSADVDDNTHHGKTHGPSITYNSRVILGRERIDFAQADLDPKEIDCNNFVYCYDGPDYGGPTDNADLSGEAFFPRSIWVFGHGAFPEPINEVGIELLSAGSGIFVILSETSGWSLDIDYGDQGLLHLTQEDFNSHENNVILMEWDGPIVAEQLKIEVEIEADTGNYTRIHEVGQSFFSTDTGDPTNDFWAPLGNVFYYPDQRAKHINLYRNYSGVYKLAASFPLKASKKANFSFLYTGIFGLPILKVGGVAIPSTEVNSEQEYIPSKVVASVINSALAFESDLVYTIGRNSEPVTGFAVNAIEVSQGQFGQYPLFVFKSEGIWALEQTSPEIVFGRITPVDVSIGADNESMICTAGQTIVFANANGVYILDGTRPVKISDPVASIHGVIRALGYLRSSEDEQILISTGLRTYHYSLTFKRWFSSTSINSLRRLFSDDEQLYGLSEYRNIGTPEIPIIISPALLDYSDPDLGVAVHFQVELDAVHFGYPDILKRFYLFYLRGVFTELDAFNVTLGEKFFHQTKKQNRPKWRSEYAADIAISGDGATTLHRIDAEFDLRYPRKQRS